MTQEKPLISIIVPCYNVEKYIEKCLNSLLKQSYQNIECICIDDGSMDGTGDILHNYAKMDNRVHVIVQENSGVSEARNAGLKLATGTYIMFVDGDDWIDKQTCESAMRLMKTTQAELVIWSYTREYRKCSLVTYVIGNEEKRWDESTIDQLYCRLIGLTGEELKEPQKTDSLVTVWGKLYEKNIIEGIFFKNLDEVGATGEDLIFNIEAFARLKKAAYLPIAFSHYRKDNTQSITSTYKYDLAQMWNNQYKMIRRQLEHENRSEVFFEALSNRIVLGLIGLGLSLIGDENITVLDKRSELKRFLNMPQYQKTLRKFGIDDLPIHWRVFFFSLQHNMYFVVLILLYTMNRLRSKGQCFG